MSIPSWTYSQIDSFESCPKKFFHLRVAKDFVDPPSEHSEWGTRVHTAFEHRIQHGTPLAEGMEHWEPIAQKIYNMPGAKYPEIKLAISKAFQPTSWDDSWSRGIVDLLIVHKNRAVVLDYKTGKRKPSEQLMLYSAFTLAHYKEVEEVSTGYVWLKEHKVDRRAYTRADIPHIWQDFLPRVRKLERAYENDKWPAKPSGLCNGWCPVTTCEFNRKRG